MQAFKNFFSSLSNNKTKSAEELQTELLKTIVKAIDENMKNNSEILKMNIQLVSEIVKAIDLNTKAIIDYTREKYPIKYPTDEEGRIYI